MRGEAVEGGDKNLDDVFLVERIVALAEGGNHLMVDAGPVHVEEHAVVAERGFCCGV